MLTFKQFLFEGGKETASFNTERANSNDIKKAIAIVSKVLGDSKTTLEDQLLGTVSLTLQGKKKDSGDIDMAYPIEKMEEANRKMLSHTNNEGRLNTGTKVGSYALDVGGKKVQLDLMFVKDIEFAKFGYHSAQGDGSKYPGAVRNIILTTALAHVQEPGKDFVHRDADGTVLARASRSIKLGDGMERLFKMRRKNKKTGEYLKSLDNATPEELMAEYGNKFKFSKEIETITDPNKVAEFIFGIGVKAKDIMTAEDVIKHIKKMKNATEVLAASKEQLAQAKLPIPSEL